VPGKVDWLARGMPVEGDEADKPRVGAIARDDVVTCGLETPIGQVRDQVAASPYGFGLVVWTDGTVLGRLRGSDMAGADDGATAEQLMQPGPSTVRCDLPVEELRKRLDEKDLKTSLVSTPEGKLVGVVTRRQLDPR
jgi:CBS domain-containing protein